MCLSSLKITLPYPFSSKTSVILHPSPNDTVFDLIKTTIHIAKDPDQVPTVNYGFYFPSRNGLLLPDVPIESYKDLLIDLKEDEQILLIPNVLHQLTMYCYKYKATVECAPDQKISAVVRNAISIFSKEDPEFFSGNDWAAYDGETEIDSSITVQKLLKISDTFSIRKSHNEHQTKKTSDFSIFGKPLISAYSLEKQNTKVPTFITECIKLIQEKNKTEGLFRKNGGQAQIEQMAHALDSCNDLKDIPAIVNVQNVHDITGLLKYYFKNLPDPLLPFRFYTILEKLIKEPQTNENLFSMKKILSCFPIQNYNILKAFFECILNTLTESESNKMTISSMAICVSAILIKNPDAQANPIETNSVTQKIITELLTNYEYYFNDKPIMMPSEKHMTTNKDIERDGSIIIPQGEQIYIIDKTPENHENEYLVEYQNQNIFVPSDSLESMEISIDDEFVLPELKPDFMIQGKAQQFICLPTMKGNKKSLDFLNNVIKETSENISKIEALLKNLEDPGDTDINEILWELNQMLETTAF